MDKKYKLIIIDLYGVLTTGNYRNISGWLAMKYNLDPDYVYNIVYHKYFNQAALGKISERESFVRALKELNMKEDWRKIRKKHLSYLVLDKKVFNLALKWQKQGYQILFLSKNVPSQFRDLLNRYQLKKYFKYIINTYDLGLPKASKKTMIHVLNKFKVKPKEVIYIDDQDFNLSEAKRMGAKTILYKGVNDLRKKLGSI